jgi:hypothetical protein
MEIEVLTTGEEQAQPVLEPIIEGVERIEETNEAVIAPKAKPKRTAKPRVKAVRFEGREAVGSAGSSSAPTEPKVKPKSRAKENSSSSAKGAAEELGLEAAGPQGDQGVTPQGGLEETRKDKGRGGRPAGARNKPKPPTIVERIVEKTVYEKAPQLSPQDLQSLLKDTLRKQELEARERKRAYYSQLLRRNR